jgi:LuxR family maltose regulon positive regulatory protein
VDKWVQLALQDRLANGSLDSDLTGQVAVLQATAAAIQWNMARSLELSQQALAYLPLDSPWRSVMALCLGTAHFYSGDMATATNVLGEALRLSEADGSHYIQLIAGSFLADIQVIQGHLGQATEMYQRVLLWADHGIPQRGAIMALSGLANILCKRNDLNGALAHLQLGSEQLQQVGGAWVALAFYRSLAQVQQAQGKWAAALDALDQASQSGQNAQVGLVVAQVAALRVRVQLAQGDIAAAAVWVANSGLGVDDAAISHPGLREDEYLSFVRVLDAQGRRTEALSLLDRLLQAAEAEGRMGSAIVILILQGLISQRQGNTARALALLERALILAEPEGYVRTFLDEGEPLRRLLYNIWSQQKHQTHGNDSLLAYVEMLLAAFQAEGPPSQWQSAERRVPAAGMAMGEPVNQREREILSLIEQGFSNREIADRLLVAQSTVKWYINNLYGKLGAKSRTHALVRARELGLL